MQVFWKIITVFLAIAAVFFIGLAISANNKDLFIAGLAALGGCLLLITRPWNQYQQYWNLCAPDLDVDSTDD